MILERLIRSHGLEGQVELKGSFCMGECTNAVSYTHLDVYKRQALALALHGGG